MNWFIDTIKKKQNTEKCYNANVFSDLETQINGIQDTLKVQASKKTNTLIISPSNDPIDTLMM